jgi:hypothetical protein
MADQAMSDNMVSVHFSSELVEQMSDWGPPVQCRIVQLENGEHELLVRTVPHGIIETSTPMTKAEEAAIRKAWQRMPDSVRYAFVADLPSTREIVDPPPAPPADTEARG